MLDIYHQVRHGEEKVPFRSWNYDSWFYYYCVHGVQNWTAKYDILENHRKSKEILKKVFNFLNSGQRSSQMEWNQFTKQPVCLL